MSTHRNAWEAAEMWLDGHPVRRIVLAPRHEPPGYEVELHDAGGRVTYSDELELVDALADAFDRRQRQESERADTEPPPDTVRDALTDDTEPLYSAERDHREPGAVVDAEGYDV